MSKITVRKIADERRSRWIALNLGFGEGGVIFEKVFYHVLSESCPDYCGGYFDFVEASNGACWLAPSKSERSKKCNVSSLNGWEGEMTFGALCLACATVAVNRLCWDLYEKGNERASEKFSQMFYALREVCIEHPESSAIFAYLD